MYIVSLITKVSPSEMQKHLAAHLAYLENQLELGHLIAAGPKTNRTGGILIASVADRTIRYPFR